MILKQLKVPTADFEQATGWQLKPEGACRADLCIPLREAHAGNEVDVKLAAKVLGMPLVHEPEAEIWALGPAAPTSKALLSAQAPPLELPDLDGKPFDLASLRGKRVLIYAWAPY